MKIIQNHSVSNIWVSLPNGYYKVNTCWLLLNLKEEGNFAVCNNIDELGGQYPKWNKTVAER